MVVELAHRFSRCPNFIYSIATFAVHVLDIQSIYASQVEFPTRHVDDVVLLIQLINLENK